MPAGEPQAGKATALHSGQAHVHRFARAHRLDREEEEASAVARRHRSP